MSEALANCDGVKDVQIDYDHKLATAIVNEAFESPETLVRAVKQANPAKYAKTTLK